MKDESRMVSGSGSESEEVKDRLKGQLCSWQGIEGQDIAMKRGLTLLSIVTGIW